MERLASSSELWLRWDKPTGGRDLDKAPRDLVSQANKLGGNNSRHPNIKDPRDLVSQVNQLGLT